MLHAWIHFDEKNIFKWSFNIELATADKIMYKDVLYKVIERIYKMDYPEEYHVYLRKC